MNETGKSDAQKQRRQMGTTLAQRVLNASTLLP